MKVFKAFDLNGDGFLSKDEIKEAMQKMGESADDDRVNEMLAEVDTNGDGKVDYEEFARYVASKE